MKTSKSLVLALSIFLCHANVSMAAANYSPDNATAPDTATAELFFALEGSTSKITTHELPSGGTFSIDIFYSDTVSGLVNAAPAYPSFDSSVLRLLDSSQINFTPVAPGTVKTIPSKVYLETERAILSRNVADNDPDTDTGITMGWGHSAGALFAGQTFPLSLATLRFEWISTTKSRTKITLANWATATQIRSHTGQELIINGPPLPEKPGAPTNAMAVANGATGINLTWGAPANQGCATPSLTCIAGYKIERATDDSFSAGLIVLRDFSHADQLQTNFSDTGGLTTGTTYYYRISAQNTNADPNKVGTDYATATRGAGAPTITGSTARITAIKGLPLAEGNLFTVTNTGGTPAVYTYSPLIAGLSINASTGAITGTPNGPDGLTTHTITATANGFTDTATLMIESISAGIKVSTTSIATTTNGKGNRGRPVTFNVSLLSEPDSDVTVELKVTGTDTSTISTAASLSGLNTFTTTNWDILQTVTVTGAQSDTNQMYAIVITSTSDDSNYAIPESSVQKKIINGENVAPPKLSATPGSATPGEYTATVGTLIDLEKIITSIGGDVEMYKWSPKGGPTGITINAGNGRLNGTPSTAIDKMSYDIVATNIAGTATISISFSAVSAPTGTVDSNSVGYSIMQTGTSATLKITASAPISGAKVGPYTDNGTMFLKDQLLAHARETGNVKGPGTDPNSRINIDDERYLLRVNVDSKSCASGCDLEFMISEADLPDGVSSSDELVIFTYDFVGGIWTALATEAIQTTGTGPVSYTVTASTNSLSGAVALGNIRSINQLTVAAASRLVRSIMPKVTQALLASTVVSIEDRISANLRGKPLAQLLKFNGTTINIGSSDLGFMDTIKKKIGSKSTWKQLEKTANGEAINFEFDWKKALTKSSFSLPINSLRRKRSKGQDASAGGAIWGRGDYRNLRSKEDVNWKADLVSFQLGADAKFYDNLLLGGMVSWHESDGDYSLNEGGVQKGDFNHKMISLHPYAAWSDKGVTIWGSFGYGQGELEALDQSNTKHSSDTEMFALSTGIKGKLLPMLNVKADVALAWTEIDKSNTYDGTVGIKEETVNTQRYRFILEAKNDYKTKFGNFTPSAEVGARYDTGDGDNGVGAELGGGLKYFNPKMGLSVEGRGRTLVGQSGYREWGIGGAIRLSQSKGGRGLSFKLEPTYGDRKSDKNSVFNSVNTKQGENKAADNYSAGMKTELSYGLLGFNDQGLIKPYGSMNLSNKVQTYKMGIDITGLEGNGSLKPYGTMSLNENNNSKYTMGIDWNPGSVFTMKLFGERNYKAKDNKTDNAMKIEGKLRF